MKAWSNSDTPPAGNNIPEKRLFAAVLQRAITDFLTGEGEVKEGARLWLMEDEPTDAPLTFLFICEALDLDVRNLRRAITTQESEGVVVDESIKSKKSQAKSSRGYSEYATAIQ